MITFIIPAYNAEKTLSDCIKSVLLQNVEKEIIVVDNNSTDNTSQIIRNYPVKYFFESEKGPAAAKNKGLKETNFNSEYIAFVDSDVVLPNDWAKKAIDLLERYPEVAGVGGPGKSIIRNFVSESFDYLLFGRTSNQKLKFVKHLATMDVMYKKQHIDNIFFNKKLIAAEDPDFNFRLIKKGYKLLYSEDLWVWHHNPTTLKQMCKKWFNYGIYYPLPYFWNNQLKDFGLWGRILYFPIVLFCSVYCIFAKNFIPLSLIVFSIPLVYCYLGIKAGIKNFYKLLLFIILHFLKQITQITGIWYGIILRILR